VCNGLKALKCSYIKGLKVLRMNISLGEFERRHGVNKGTVSRKAKALGIDTTDGLTPEAYQRLLEVFDIDPTATATPVAIAEEEAPGALAYYGQITEIAPAGGSLLGDIANRLATRETNRLQVGQSFQNVFNTRRQRAEMLIEAAVLDAQTDAEIYAAVYQRGLEEAIARHTGAAGLVMGKDATGAAGGGS